MLGDRVPLANTLWLVLGDRPRDIPNALLYRAGDRLYLIDSGEASEPEGKFYVSNAPIETPLATFVRVSGMLLPDRDLFCRV